LLGVEKIKRVVDEFGWLAMVTPGEFALAGSRARIME
jgi:hypothetical protein